MMTSNPKDTLQLAEMSMRLRYFVVDDQGQLRKASQVVVEGIWRNNRSIHDLGFRTGCDLRLITAICDNELEPQVVFLLRLALVDGAVSEAARQLAYQSIRSVMRDQDPKSERSVFEFHTEGWPNDWRPQLAIALDTPLARLNWIAIGGPLPASDLMGVSVKGFLKYFDHAVNQ